MIFDGNAPSVGNNVFSGVASNCIVYVNAGSTGWGVDIPGTWKGLKIFYISQHPPLAHRWSFNTDDYDYVDSITNAAPASEFGPAANRKTDGGTRWLKKSNAAIPWICCTRSSAICGRRTTSRRCPRSLRLLPPRRRNRRPRGLRRHLDLPGARPHRPRHHGGADPRRQGP